MTEDDKKSNKMAIQQDLFLPRRRAKSSRKIVLYVSISLLIIAAIIAGGGYVYIQSALKPLSPQSKEQKIVVIPSGSTITGVADILAANGIIKDAQVFKYYVKFKKESGLIAGSYRLSPSMDVSDIISRLKSGKVSPAVTITIPEGTQLKEIASTIAKAVHKPENEVFNQLNNRNYIKKLMAKYPGLLTNEIVNSKVIYPLEGYLYPATYPFYKTHPTVDEIVAAMLDKTNSVLAPYRNQIKQRKYTIHQFLTIASLIEEEATKKADRSKIASVFYNRIQKGIPLQTDPTVLYAEGKHKERVLYQDLEVNSPYNTYKNAGLPPGPISNAGIVSIEAALHPAVTDYYYFLAAPDGSVIFSKTLAEHDAEKAKFISNKK